MDSCKILCTSSIYCYSITNNIKQPFPQERCSLQ